MGQDTLAMGKRADRNDSPLASVVVFWNYNDTVDMQQGLGRWTHTLMALC